MAERFRERYPTFKQRLHAESAAATPDSKSPILPVMEAGRKYTMHELGVDCAAFLGFKTTPLYDATLWGFVHRPWNKGGILSKKGFIENAGLRKVELGSGSFRYGSSYMITEDGETFGRSSAILGAHAVNEALKLDPVPQNASLFSLFSGTQTKAPGTNPAYVRYQIFRVLAERPSDQFSVTEISEKTGLDRGVTSRTVLKLGRQGILLYHSGEEKIRGVAGRRFATYTLIGEQIDEEKAFNAALKNLNYRRIFDFPELVNYINSNPREEYEHNDLAVRLKLEKANVTALLACLANAGFLKPIRKVGTKGDAQAKPVTITFWENFFAPLGDMATAGTPNVSSVERILSIYENKKLLAKTLRRQQDAYEEESTLNKDKKELNERIATRVLRQKGEVGLVDISRAIAEETGTVSYLIGTMGKLIRTGKVVQLEKGGLYKWVGTSRD